MHTIYTMQNAGSSTANLPSNTNTPIQKPQQTPFRSMSFINSGSRPSKTHLQKSTSNPAVLRTSKNFMFNTPMRPNNLDSVGSRTPVRSMRMMNIPDPVIPTPTPQSNANANAQPSNYNLRMERKPIPDKKTQAEAYAKVQARAEAIKLRAKIKAEADVKARAAARTTARAAAKAAAIERAQRAQQEAANARARIPTWERNAFDADPSDTPYGI